MRTTAYILLLLILPACGDQRAPDITLDAETAFSEETLALLKLSISECKNTKAKKIGPSRLSGRKTPGYTYCEYAFNGTVVVETDCLKESTNFSGYPDNLFYHNYVHEMESPFAESAVGPTEYIPLKKGERFEVKGAIIFTDYEKDHLDKVKVRILEYR